MYLTEEQKLAIASEYTSFVDSMYAGKTKKERQELDQFFTPAELTIKMLESLDCTYEEFLDSDIIDPTSGSGNLLAAALIIGADPHRVYGNEYDATMVTACRKRLKSINSKVRDWQIHQGNALLEVCLTEFNKDYDKTILQDLLTYRPAIKGTWLEQPNKYGIGKMEQVDLFGGLFND